MFKRDKISDMLSCLYEFIPDISKVQFWSSAMWRELIGQCLLWVIYWNSCSLQIFVTNKVMLYCKSSNLIYLYQVHFQSFWEIKFYPLNVQGLVGKQYPFVCTEHRDVLFMTIAVHVSLTYCLFSVCEFQLHSLGLFFLCVFTVLKKNW